MAFHFNYCTPDPVGHLRSLVSPPPPLLPACLPYYPLAFAMGGHRAKCFECFVCPPPLPPFFSQALMRLGRPRSVSDDEGEGAAAGAAGAMEAGGGGGGGRGGPGSESLGLGPPPSVRGRGRRRRRRLTSLLGGPVGFDMSRLNDAAGEGGGGQGGGGEPEDGDLGEGESEGGGTTSSLLEAAADVGGSVKGRQAADA